MNNSDKKSPLEREPYSYRVITDNKVFIYKENRLLIMLRNNQAEDFIKKILILHIAISLSNSPKIEIDRNCRRYN